MKKPQLMNAEQLIEAILIAGTYEVVSKGDGSFVLTPMEHGEIKITKDSDSECAAYFRRREY